MLPPFTALLLSERARGLKSGHPPLLAPSFKVQGEIAHKLKSSGFVVAPGLRPQRARTSKGPAGNQRYRSAFQVVMVGLIVTGWLA
jgi:hypothetical protein